VAKAEHEAAAEFDESKDARAGNKQEKKGRRSREEKPQERTIKGRFNR
jgi:hypothetical protein